MFFLCSSGGLVWLSSQRNCASHPWGLVWLSSQRNCASHSMQVISVKDYDLYCHYVAGLVGVGLSQLFASSGARHRGMACLCACGAVRGTGEWLVCGPAGLHTGPPGGVRHRVVGHLPQATRRATSASTAGWPCFPAPSVPA